MEIVITGVTGFIGNAIVERLLQDDIVPLGIVRRDLVPTLQLYPVVNVGDINAKTNWSGLFSSDSVVVHLAARVHVMKEREDNPLKVFREVNVAGTLNLAQKAAEAGAKRFVYLSSIKVNGECTPLGQPFLPTDRPNPADPYAVSKFEAEEGLRKISKETGMELVIIRPVLVYGPGVKGNFHSMMRWLSRGAPLPFGNINNARSLVALDNLVDLVISCIAHPKAANQTFLVSDGEDISTESLIKKMGAHLGVQPRLFSMPHNIIKMGAIILGKHEISKRLYNSLQVDISKTKNILNWSPPLTLDMGLYKATIGFKP